MLHSQANTAHVETCTCFPVMDLWEAPSLEQLLDLWLQEEESALPQSLHPGVLRL